jgi:purine-cytosine permease-like protein
MWTKGETFNPWQGFLPAMDHIRSGWDLWIPVWAMAIIAVAVLAFGIEASYWSGPSAAVASAGIVGVVGLWMALTRLGRPTA